MSDAPDSSFRPRGTDRRQHQLGMEEAERIEERRREARRIEDLLREGQDRRGLVNEYDRLVFEQIGAGETLMIRLNEMIVHSLEDVRPMLDERHQRECRQAIADFVARRRWIAEIESHLTAEDRQRLTVAPVQRQRCAALPADLADVVQHFNETFRDTPLPGDGL